LQLDALRAAGCDVVHEDRLSGMVANRPLSSALAACQAGDVLHVWKLDRLGRSMMELVGIVDDLRRRGVGLKVLTGEGAAIDTTRPEGRLILGVFAASRVVGRGQGPASPRRVSRRRSIRQNDAVART
jgi:DNA invertase Pin-like site-specific DNA recombinase